MTKENSFFRKQPLLAFFVFAFAFTWIILAPGVASSLGLINFKFDGTVLTIISGFGPFLAAILVSIINEGKDGVKKMFVNFFKFRNRSGWLFISIALFVFLFAFSAAFNFFTGGGFPSTKDGLFLNGGNAVFVIILLLVGSFGEETGWRGFALSRLQKTNKPLTSALILTLIWWVWHIPTYWTLPYAINAFQQYGFFIAFGIQFIVLFALSILCSWVFNGSKGNVLMPILMHFGWNFWVGGFGENPSLLMMPLLLITAIAVSLITKGKLSYIKE